MWACVGVYVHVCMCVYVCASMCVYVCASMCVYVCASMCMYVCASIRVCIHMFQHAVLVLHLHAQTFSIQGGCQYYVQMPAPKADAYNLHTVDKFPV